MRKNLLPFIARESPSWLELIEAVDEVWKKNIDDPRRIAPTLRDTYVYNETALERENTTEYKEVTAVLLSGNTYTVDSVDFTDLSYTFIVVLETRSIATSIDPNATTTFTRLFTGTDPESQTYQILSGNRIILNFDLGENQTVKVAQYRKSTFDLLDFYDYGQDIQTATFAYDDGPFGELDIRNTIPVGEGEPAGLGTGYPYSLTILEGANSANGIWESIPIGFYQSAIATLEDPDKPYTTIQFLGVEYPFIRVTLRRTSPEVSNKLKQLGFGFENVEYVTRPSVTGNSYIMQMITDNMGQYLKETEGTKSYMDFFQFCTGATFEIMTLWAQDNGFHDRYQNLTREDVLPENWKPIWETESGEGGWYPTSHVALVFDIFLYGSTYTTRGTVDFFNYSSPANLVLNHIVFQGPRPTEVSSMYLSGALSYKIVFK